MTCILIYKMCTSTPRSLYHKNVNKMSRPFDGNNICGRKIIIFKLLQITLTLTEDLHRLAESLGC